MTYIEMTADDLLADLQQTMFEWWQVHKQITGFKDKRLQKVYNLLLVVKDDTLCKCGHLKSDCTEETSDDPAAE